MSTDPLAHLRDPDPPAPDQATLAAVRHRAQRRRRRHRAASITIAAVAVLALSISVAVTRRDGDGLQVATDATVTTREVATVSTAPAPPPGVAPTGDVARCFPEAATPQPAPSPTSSTGSDPWPDGAPPLLALTGQGQVWVLHGGKATLWTPPTGSTNHRYLWARFEDAGTILASRLVDTAAVVLDRLTLPGQATPVATLPYTVSAQAIPGSCPIDGYLARFAARPEGVVLAKHVVGPIAPSCPARADGASCSPAAGGLTFEIRPTSTLSQPGSNPGIFIGTSGNTTMVADAERSSAYAWLDPTAGISVVRPDTPVPCCYGGQRGSAFSLSAQGDQLAYSPDGTDLRVVELVRASDTGRQVWKAPQQITATAFTTSWVAVAHGTSISLLSPDGTRHLDLATPQLHGIKSLDWAA